VAFDGRLGPCRLVEEWRLRERFEHGTYLIELAPLSDPGFIPAAVATALGVREQPGMSMLQSVVAVSAGRQRLMVFDNCEHMLDAAAGVCEAMLRASGDLRILATSREPLRLGGEARYPLAPLPVPDESSDRPVGDYEAVALFVERAQQADPDFGLTETSRAMVAEIVRRVDGMPLAIELAAARVSGLPLAEVRDRLDDRFRLLVGGSRTAAPRQRSLEATIDWSYQLLTPIEQNAFRRLSRFQAPFSLTAAEAVAGPEAVDVVPALVERSLLVSPREGPDGRSRYAMLDTLRAYGAERLATTTEASQVAAAMAVWAIRGAERTAGEILTSDRELAASRWFDAEIDNLRCVLDWALDNEAVVALRLAVALGGWWFLRGMYSEGRSLLDRALSGYVHPDADLAATARVWLGRLAAASFDLNEALLNYTRRQTWRRPPERRLGWWTHRSADRER
jgi:predicted ATPase